MASHSAEGLYQRPLAPLVTALAAGAILFAVHAFLDKSRQKDASFAQLSEFARQGAELLAGATLEAAEPVESLRAGTFQPWAGSLVAGETVELVACINNDGRVVATIPSGTPIADMVQKAQGSFDVRGMLASPEGGPLAYATSPIRGFPGGATIGQLMIVGSPLAQVPAAAWFATTPAVAGAFLGIALITGLAGLYAGSRHRSSALSHLLPRENQTQRAWHGSLPTRRQDDIGKVARVLDRLYRDCDSARAELNTLKQTLDARVADRTRQVNAMLQRAEEKAWKDPLTKLGNRRLLEDRLQSIFETQAEAGDDLSIVMIDLDHFKKLNDTLGHAAGDELLAFLGQLLRGTLRPTDIGIRYGGDEFCLLLLGVDEEQAAQAAQRISRLFAQHASTLSITPRPSLSMGIASLNNSNCMTGNELLGKADEALYAGKRAGRNCVKCAGGVDAAASAAGSPRAATARQPAIPR